MNQMNSNCASNSKQIEPRAKKRAIENGTSTCQARPEPTTTTTTKTERVYLDYNATTPLEPTVLDAIYASLKYVWGNPSSSYPEGRMAKRVIDEARAHVSKMVNSNPQDIVFTSGGTEANNLVFYSVIKKFNETGAERSTTQADQINCTGGHPRPHIITSNIEHDSVILALRSLEKAGKIELTEVQVSEKAGHVNVKDVTSAVKWNTVLVTIMLANNETGVIQPIEEISKTVCLKNKSRIEANLNPIYVHTDAAQAIGKIPVDCDALGVDYLTIVGHKFYGPRIGALFARKLGMENGTPLCPIFYGGGQERNYRPGTENTGMIAGLGEACRLVAENLNHYKNHMQEIRDYLENQLEVEFKGHVSINNRFLNSKRLPNTCNVSILGPNLQGRKVLAAASYLQASVGAACHSDHGDRPSHILTACGVPEKVGRNAIRLSVGRYTTEYDIDLVIQDLKDVVRKLNSAS